MKSTIVKVGVGFLLGATAIGGVATAANSDPIGVKACVDKKTQVMYLAANDKCISSRTLVTLGASSIDVKSITMLLRQRQLVDQYLSNSSMATQLPQLLLGAILIMI